ncbi:unnamed protein product [Caenorhabditis brenneri]
MAPPIPKRWTTNPEYIDLLNYLIKRTENVESPMRIKRIAIEFKEKRGAAQPVNSLFTRIESVRTRIHSFKHIDTNTKVKLIFALSASVDANFLRRMKKEAIVEVDNKKRITYYKANDGRLELSGDHSHSAKNRTAQLESKRSHQSLIRCYFENKNNPDAVPKNETEKKIGNLIDFITEKCDNVISPLNITQVAKDFGISGRTMFIYRRIHSYCREIQNFVFMDTPSKVKQLFGMSAKLNSDFLKELRKDAIVEVDDRNRITKYTANDGSLTLSGRHSSKAKALLAGIEERKRKNTEKKHSNSGCDEGEERENENGYSEDDSDEYSSEEFDSDFNSDDENDLQDEPDQMDSSNGVLDFDYETPIRNRSPTDSSIDDNFDFDPPTDRSHRSEENERGADEENDPEITGNASVKKRYKRLPKRRHLDSEFSNNQENSSCSGASMNTESSSSKPAKQKKIAIETSNSSSQSRRSSRSTRRSNINSPCLSTPTESGEHMEDQDASNADGNPSDYHGPRIQEMDDHEYNSRADNLPESSPIDNQIEEPKPQATEEHNKNNGVQNTDKRSDTVAPEPKPEKECLTLQNNQNSNPQTNGNEFISVESHIRFLESLISMMNTLETPTLTEDQLRIEKSIKKFQSSGNEEEKIRLNEIRTSLITCLLMIERSAKKKVVKGEDSTSLKEFLLVFHNFLFSLRLKELNSFVTRIKHMIKELKDNDKKFPTRNIQLALQFIIETIAP